MNTHAKVLRDLSNGQDPLTAAMMKDAANEIERLERECEIDQRNAAASQKEAADLLDKLQAETFGTIHEDAMFLRTAVGTAADPDTGEEVYEMSSGMGGTPILRNLKNKKSFTISWQELIAMAEAKGIRD